MSDPKSRAIAELIFAGLVWGFGFVATIWALEEFSTIGFMFTRFLIAFFAGELLRLLVFKGQPWHLGDFKLSIGAGILMALFLIPQTLGLLFTTATNSGFLTILYVILVPILSFIFLQHRHKAGVYWLAGLAFIGAWLLMGGSFSSFNTGDLLTIGCAFMAAVHILYVGRIAQKIQDPFRFNNYQSLWCLLVVIPCIWFDPHFSMKATSLKPWIGLLSTAIGSSLIGFMIQIRAQKVLSETTAAQFFLLESPFALLFGYMILDEKISGVQLLGASLILLSSFLTIRLEKSIVS